VPNGSDLQVVGFVCGTLSSADRLTQESMGLHEPGGGALLTCYSGP
jgi:hypothetical protein